MPESSLIDSMQQSRVTASDALLTGDAQLRLWARAFRLEREARAGFLDGDLFYEPAWNILLFLYESGGSENRWHLTKEICAMAGAAPTTALRWVGTLAEAGYLERSTTRLDARQKLVRLSPKAIVAMRNYLARAAGLMSAALWKPDRGRNSKSDQTAE